MFRAIPIESFIASIGATRVQLGTATSIQAITSDSRRALWVQPTAFFAFITPSGDGHAFAHHAMAQGAAMVVLQKDHAQVPSIQAKAKEAQVHVLLVEDVWRALHQLAAQHRDQLTGEVIAITGSNGKTTVKEILYHLLEDKEVARSPRSFNSQLGVPLSILGAPMDASMLLLEVGVGAMGDMQKLAPWVQPNGGIFTSLGDAHDAGFLDRGQKLHEKASLFEGASWVVAPMSQPEIGIALQAFTTVHAFSYDDAEATVYFEWREGILSWQHNTLGIKGSAPCPHLSKIETQNIAAAITALLVMGHKWNPERLQDVRSAGVRMERQQGIQGWTLLNDSYSSDIESLSWALEVLGQAEASPKVAWVAAPEGGKDFVAWMDTACQQWGIDVWYGIGKGCEGHQHYAESVTSFLAEKPWEHLGAPGTLLIKGPRRSELERLLPYVQAQHHDTILGLDLEALAANLRHYRTILQAPRMMAMVKANAYGLGAVTIAQALVKHHVDYFGVAYADEGVALRQAGIQTPIMVMNPGEQSVETLLSYHLEPEIFNHTSLVRYGQAYVRHPSDVPGRIHIKVDTGMHRLGFLPEEGAAVAEWVSAFPGLEVVSVMTHLASAEDPSQDDFTAIQATRFTQFYEDFTHVLGYAPLRQMANTPGTVRHPTLQGDMVRLGIGLFGDSPVASDRAQLQPVVHVETRISHIQSVPAGEGLSYGHGDAATYERRIATLPMGYADGFPRALSHGVGHVLIGGQPCPVVGKVCMDMTLVDITHCAAEVGDAVEVLGANLRLHDFAQRCGTISYEVLTRFSERLGRTVWNPNA